MEIKDLDPFAFQVFSRYYQKFHIFFPDYSTEEVLKIWIKTGRYDDKLFTGGWNEYDVAKSQYDADCKQYL